MVSFLSPSPYLFFFIFVESYKPRCSAKLDIETKMWKFVFQAIFDNILAEVLNDFMLNRT